MGGGAAVAGNPLRDQPGNADILYLRGRVEEAEGQLDEAIRLLEAALAVNPGDHSACYHLVLCYQRQGNEASARDYQTRFDDIEKDQKRLLTLTNDESSALPSNPAHCCELGEVCLRLGITRRGLYWLHTALRLDPHYWPAHEQLLRYHERLGPKGEKEASFHRQQLAGRPKDQ